jgi:thiamine biosynthesis lipoprotein
MATEARKHGDAARKHGGAATEVPFVARPAPAPVSRDRRALFVPPRPAALPLQASWIRIHRRAMACQFEITVDSADAELVPAAQTALNQIDQIERQLTVFRSTSAIVDINRRASKEAVSVEPALFDLLMQCQHLSRATDGAFDITSTALSRCWGFLRREGRVPSREAIDAARRGVGMRHVELDADDSTVRFREDGVELNLGAVGKGYALDRVAVALRDAGARHALMSAGRSSLLAIGGRGRGWSIDLIAVACNRALARVWLQDAALGTSGSGEQFVMGDGQRYGHVLDPRTGWPAEGVLSSTVVCATAADADALSTAFLVGGPELARRYCDQYADVLALITPDDSSGRTFKIGNHRGAEVTEP